MAESIIKLLESTNLKESRDVINRNFRTIIEMIHEGLIASQVKKERSGSDSSNLEVGKYYDLGTISIFPTTEDTYTENNQLLKEISGVFTADNGFIYNKPSNVLCCYQNFSVFTAGKTYSFRLFDNKIIFIEFQ